MLYHCSRTGARTIAQVAVSKGLQTAASCSILTSNSYPNIRRMEHKYLSNLQTNQQELPYFVKNMKEVTKVNSKRYSMHYQKTRMKVKLKRNREKVRKHHVTLISALFIFFQFSNLNLFLQ